MRFRFRSGLLVTALLVAASVVLPQAGRLDAARTAATFVGPKAYYLALGDSLAYGFQPRGIENQGYADDFDAQMGSATGITPTLIDMGCIDETLTTFVNGGCPFRRHLKHQYYGAQLNAALKFITKHPGQVSPVTIDIGANDFLAFFDSWTCTITPTSQISQTQLLNTFAMSYTNVLSQLKQALGGTGDLLTMNYYFPYQNACYNRLKRKGELAQFQQLMDLVQRFDTTLAQSAQSVGVPVVDVFTAFGGATTPNPNICTDTWMCHVFVFPTSSKVHPTSTGYSIIAKGFKSLSGY